MKQLALVCLVLGSACSRADAPPSSKVLESAALASAPMITPASYQVQAMAPAPTGLEAALLGVATCPIEDFQVAPSCGGMLALANAAKFADGVRAVQIGTRLVGHAAPAVRIQAATLLAQSTDASAHAAIADAGMRERDPAVLRAFVHLLARAGTTPKVAAFLVGAAGHAEAAVRLEAVGAIAKQRGLPGGAQKLAQLIESDTDPAVRRAACASAGKLGDDALLPIYRKMTEAATEPALYAACMEGVVAMFHDHPSFETASEGAYRLFLERLATKPRTAASPPWTVMSTFCYLSHEPDLAKLDAWRARATWFDAAEAKRVIAEVVADRAADWKARSAGVESLVGLGATKAELAALRRGLSVTDENDRQVLAKLDSALAP